MIVNYCDKHNPTYVEHRLSNELIKDIKDDKFINTDDLIAVKFKFKDGIENFFFFYKDFFIENKIKDEYIIGYEYFTDEQMTLEEDEVGKFSEKFIGSICSKCLTEYENKHGISITGGIKRPSIFDL